MKEIIRVWVAVTLLFSIFLPFIVTAPARAILTEYLNLTGQGESMIPTIYPGDKVKVKLRANGTSIKTGLKNSSNSGDLIVYGVIAALVYIPQPSRMFICHRVIEKYVKDGVWFFRTMGDNNPEPDPWEVPQYWVLGVVVQITHRNLSRSEPLDYSSDLPDRPIENPGSSHLLALGDLAVGILVGLSLGFVAAKIARKPAWR